MASLLVARIANTAITTLSLDGVVDLTSYLTFFITDAGASAVTLNAGQEVGQRKRLQLSDASVGGSTVVTSSVLHSATTITFSAIGDAAELIWDGAKWRIISVSNVTGNANTPVIA